MVDNHEYNLDHNVEKALINIEFNQLEFLSAIDTLTSELNNLANNCTHPQCPKCLAEISSQSEEILKTVKKIKRNYHKVYNKSVEDKTFSYTSGISLLETDAMKDVINRFSTQDAYNIILENDDPNNLRNQASLYIMYLGLDNIYPRLINACEVTLHLMQNHKIKGLNDEEIRNSLEEFKAEKEIIHSELNILQTGKTNVKQFKNILTLLYTYPELFFMHIINIQKSLKGLEWLLDGYEWGKDLNDNYKHPNDFITELKQYINIVSTLFSPNIKQLYCDANKKSTMDPYNKLNSVASVSNMICDTLEKQNISCVSPQYFEDLTQKIIKLKKGSYLNLNFQETLYLDRSVYAHIVVYLLFMNNTSTLDALDEINNSIRDYIRGDSFNKTGASTEVKFLSIGMHLIVNKINTIIEHFNPKNITNKVYETLFQYRFLNKLNEIYKIRNLTDKDIVYNMVELLPEDLPSQTHKKCNNSPVGDLDNQHDTKHRATVTQCNLDVVSPYENILTSDVSVKQNMDTAVDDISLCNYDNLTSSGISSYNSGSISNSSIDNTCNTSMDSDYVSDITNDIERTSFSSTANNECDIVKSVTHIPSRFEESNNVSTHTNIQGQDDTSLASASTKDKSAVKDKKEKPPYKKRAKRHAHLHIKPDVHTPPLDKVAVQPNVIIPQEQETSPDLGLNSSTQDNDTNITDTPLVNTVPPYINDIQGQDDTSLTSNSTKDESTVKDKKENPPYKKPSKKHISGNINTNVYPITHLIDHDIQHGISQTGVDMEIGINHLIDDEDSTHEIHAPHRAKCSTSIPNITTQYNTYIIQNSRTSSKYVADFNYDIGSSIKFLNSIYIGYQHNKRPVLLTQDINAVPIANICIQANIASYTNTNSLIIAATRNYETSTNNDIVNSIKVSSGDRNITSRNIVVGNIQSSNNLESSSSIFGMMFYAESETIFPYQAYYNITPQLKNVITYNSILLSPHTYSQYEWCSRRKALDKILIDFEHNSSKKSYYSFSRTLRDIHRVCYSMLERTSSYKELHIQYPNMSAKELILTSPLIDNLDPNQRLELTNTYINMLANIIRSIQKSTNIQKLSFADILQSLTLNQDIEDKNNLVSDNIGWLVINTHNKKLKLDHDVQDVAPRTTNIPTYIDPKLGVRIILFAFTDSLGQIPIESDALYITVYYDKKGKIINCDYPPTIQFINKRMLVKTPNGNYFGPLTQDQLQYIDKQISINNAQDMSFDTKTLNSSKVTLLPLQSTNEYDLGKNKRNTRKETIANSRRNKEEQKLKYKKL